MEGTVITAAPSEQMETVEQESQEEDGYTPSPEWPPEPEPLPTRPEQEAQSTETDTATESEDDESDDVVEDVADEQTPPTDARSDRAERRRQRILEEYRSSAAYAEEVERAASAAREADRIEREAEEARESQRRRIEQATLTQRQKLARFVGTTSAGPEGRQSEYDLDLAFVAAEEAKIKIAALDGEDDYVEIDPEVKKKVQEARSRITRWDEAREMQAVIDDAAWSTIKDDYEAILDHPSLAAADAEVKGRIKTPDNLKAGMVLAVETALGLQKARYDSEVAAAKKAYEEEVAGLRTDLTTWKARAGGAGAQAETRTTDTSGGGLTFERYQRMTPDEAAGLSPAEINRMMAAERERRAQQRT